MKNCFLIVNYNDFKSTKHLVDNIKDYDYIDKILIVDNNSNSNEKESLKSIKEKKVEIIYNEANVGYSSAINIGARYLNDIYDDCNIIISNSDIVILSEDDLKYMLDLLNNKDIGLVGPQILELGHISKGYKNIKPMTDILLNTPILRRFVKEHVYLYDDDYYDSEVSFVDVINSSFFMISMSTLKKINYLDENIFLYYEDFIISKKVKNLGLSVAVCNNIKIKHLYSISVDKSYMESEKYRLLKDSQLYYHVTYNNANVLEKNIIKISKKMGLFIRKIKEIFHKK